MPVLNHKCNYCKERTCINNECINIWKSLIKDQCCKCKQKIVQITKQGRIDRYYKIGNYCYYCDKKIEKAIKNKKRRIQREEKFVQGRHKYYSHIYQIFTNVWK